MIAKFAVCVSYLQMPNNYHTPYAQHGLPPGSSGSAPFRSNGSLGKASNSTASAATQRGYVTPRQLHPHTN